MSLDPQLTQALADARRDNSHLMNRIRIVGSAAFALVALPIRLLVEAPRNDGEQTWWFLLCGALAYLVVSVVIHLTASRFPGVRRLGSLSVPLLDIPAITVIQSIVITHTDHNAGNVSEFSIALLVCCILLSTFTLDSRKVGLTIIIAIAAEQWLQHLAGISLGGRLASLVVFGIVSWICIFAGKNRIDLVTRVTNANTRRSRLQRYFSPGVGELIEEHDQDELAQGKECELTIVFTDIRGFTHISEHLSGSETVQFLNLYHARMVEAVFEHGGTLDKYLGDGLMVYFNAPVTQTDHARRAIQCAVQMHEEVAKLNDCRPWASGTDLKIGIGIHSGRAILGDIGAPHRREFTAIGDSVNVAARLQEMTKKHDQEILVSRATADLVGDGFDWTSIGHLKLRNRDRTVEVLSPTPSR